VRVGSSHWAHNGLTHLVLLGSRLAAARTTERAWRQGGVAGVSSGDTWTLELVLIVCLLVQERKTLPRRDLARASEVTRGCSLGLAARWIRAPWCVESGPCWTSLALLDEGSSRCPTSTPCIPAISSPRRHIGRPMPGERLEQAVAELSVRGDLTPSSERVGESCRDAVGVSGVGVMLMAGGTVQGSLCTTDQVSAQIEELQYTFGEGPCMDAYRQDQVIDEPDLADPAVTRWLAFAPGALLAGVRAVFAFPLKVGSIRLGSFDMYMDRAGPLSDDQHADALVIAKLTAIWVLDTQAGTHTGAPPGRGDTGDFHLIVHNAAGMLSVQLGVSVTDALVRLRAYAFASGRLVTGVAEDVVARTLRFE